MLENIVFCSGGKDSNATLVLAKEYGERIDAVVFGEVMFDANTSGEHPLHRDFVYDKVQAYVKEKLKAPFIILHSPKTYTDYFYHTIARGEGKGKTAGFPIPGMCAINRDCKLKAFRQFAKGAGKDCKRQFVGIAADEPARLKRLEGTNRESLLQKYNYTEQMAKELCESEGLLSPIYDISSRNGCWFCMNCKDTEWRWLIENRPDLFDRLIALEQTPNLYRNALTFNETPTQIKERLNNIPLQYSFDFN
jgi:hypothetical protein